jgi:hypothetical protein
MDKLEFLRGFNDLGTSNTELNHFVARSAYDVYPNKFPDACKDKLGELRRELIKKKKVDWKSTTSVNWAKVYLYAPFQLARDRYKFYADYLRKLGDHSLFDRYNLPCLCGWESISYVSRA